MQSMLLYPRRSRFAPNLLKNNRTCILTLGPANVNKDGFVKSFSRPHMAIYPKGTEKA